MGAELLALGFGVLLGLLALGELTGWPFSRSPLTQQLSKLTGSTASLEGNLRVQLLFRPGIAIERLTLGSRSEMKVQHLLQAEGFVVRWRWSDLWRTRQGTPLRLKRLEANQIDAHLVRLANGDASWAADQADAPRQEKSTELPKLKRLCCVLVTSFTVTRCSILR